MIKPLPLESLVERIRTSARQGGAGSGRVSAEALARGELPPVPEPVPPPPLPARPLGNQPPSGVPTFPLEAAAGMLPRARAKITVSDRTPGLLRPLLRNQGGFNHIVLEAMERLVEVNRQLQRQNQELHARLAAMQGWMNAVASTDSQNHDWMLAADYRLRDLTADQLSNLEERLTRLENQDSAFTKKPSLPDEDISVVP